VSATIYPSIAAAVAHAKRTARSPLVFDPAEHLLARLSFGATSADRSFVAERGLQGWFDHQVALGRAHPGYGANPHVAKQGPLLAMNPYDVATWLTDHGNEYGWDAMDQLTQVTLGLQAYSPAQFYETLVDFFANHLNVPNHNGDLWNVRHTFDRDVIRRHALGSFSDMLLAAAKHPAMLLYLNLAESTKTLVNENYGRELLELHTVGLRYTESDVKNTARLLTGRTVDDNAHYVYDDYIHATGPIKVLGFTSANASAAGGEAAGDALLRYLAKHRYTAQHLAQKLCVHYVSDTPSASLVNAVAKSYLDHDTKILPTVETILRSDEFWQSRGLKVRRPAEHLIASVRALDLGVSDWSKALDSLHWMSESVGHAPLDWPAPNGYPDVASAWRSAGTLLREWNYNLGFAGGWWDGFAKLPTSRLYPPGTATSGDAIDQLTRRVTGTAFSSSDRAALQTFLGEGAGTALHDSTLRWLVEPLTALVLDGPHHALR